MTKQVTTKESPKSTDNKRTLYFLGGIFSGGLVVFLLMHFFMGKQGAELEKELIARANRINQDCPMMLDRATRFDNVIIQPGNVFQYRYTLVNAERNQVDTGEMKKFIMPNVIQNIRTTPELKFQRDNKVTFSYFYKDYNGEKVVSFPVSYEQYSAATAKQSK